MRRGGNNNNGRGGGPGGGRRGNRYNNEENRNRDDGQGRGGGRGRNGPNRGSHHQPLAPPQLVPPATTDQPVSVIRPQAAAPQQSAWTGKRWGPSSSTAPAPVDQTLTPSPVPAPSQPTVIRPQAAAPQQSAWTGKRWGPSSSTAPAPVDQTLTPSPLPAPSQPTVIRPQAAARQQSAWTGKSWGPSSSTAPAPVDQPLTPSPVPAPSQPTAAVEKPSSSSSQSDEGQIEAIRRPDHGKIAKRTLKIRVNHFRVSFDHKQIIYHYDVDAVDETPNKLPMGKRPLRKSEKRIIRDRALPDSVLQSVYDGENSIFSVVRLQIGAIQVDVDRGEEAGLRSGSYKFTIKSGIELELSKLHDYFRGILPAVPRNTLQGLDLVMKENPRICFFTDENKVELGSGLLAYKGIRSSLKPTEQGLALCLDYSFLAFPKELPVIDYLKEHLSRFRGVNDVMEMKNEINKALKGLKVKVTHRRTNQKYTIVGLTEKVARDISFELVDREGNTPPQETSLVDYFREKWGKEIRYQDISCLDVGKRNKTNVVPMEFCMLVERQRLPKENMDEKAAKSLHKLTLVPPGDRRRTISDMVQDQHGPLGELAENFGVRLLHGPNMTMVEGRVISAPELKLGGGARPVSVETEKCQWNLLGKSFVEAKPLDRWALLDFTYHCNDHCRLHTKPFVDHLQEKCRALGIQMADPVKTYNSTMKVLESIVPIEKLLRNIMDECSKKGKLQMIVCAMSQKHDGYKYLKWVSETQIGVVTQCLLSTKANMGSDQYVANLCLKINAKLGGTNFELSRRLLNLNPADHVMFIGADVNHPASNDSPSIAAVVGTVNWPAANRYAARVSPQAPRCEDIKNFGEMCAHLVTAYARINRVRPKRIVVFRDGVSEGQFEMVLGRELRDLKNSVHTNDYKPPITVIVAQKRHQTRFFPENRKDGGQSGNVPPGTVVDTTIVHPHDFDFYLCSHYGGIGTSKPTHYYVLHDENRFTSDKLQKLIYEMCFTFARCTKPVSLVPPIYYADLVAYRGRMYQEAVMKARPAPASDDSASTAASASTPSFVQRFYTLHSDLENMMFFV